jgi:phosphate-selective porin OprO/OprP
MQKTSLFGAASVGVVLALALGATAQAQETTTSWKGAPQFQNDSLTFKVRGRIYYDYVSQDVDRAVESGANVDYSARVTRLRTARLGVEGTWNSNWAYKAEVNFNGRDSSGADEVEWEDLILEYKANDTTSIMLGNMKTVSLENITSSRYTTFMERGPYNDIIDAGRVMSLQAKVNGQNWTVAGALIGDSLNDNDPAVNTTTEKASESTGVTARATFAPIDSDTTKLHLGVWARYREANEDGLFRYRARNNTNYGDRFIDSGANFDGDTSLAAEAALVWNSFSVQGEYVSIAADPAASAAAEGDVKAGYVFASWFPTGEMRRYEANKGEFNRIKVLNPVTAGGMGAIELALRYDFVDAEDFAVLNAMSGEYSAWTAGVNWYPFPYVRFMANYTKSENENAGVTFRDVDVDTLQFRAQFDF